jgi:acyl carrier protein
VTPLEFAKFAGILGDYFQFDASRITPDTQLGEELGFDSIMFLECVLMLEELAGHMIDDGAIEQIRTVGELHSLYMEYSTS